MRIDTNIQGRLTSEEKEIFSIIREVIEKYSPSTHAYAVGGWTRDKLLGVDSNDIDIMLDNISGEDFAKLVTQHLGVKDANIIRANPEKSKHITTAKAYIPLSNGETQEIDFAQARAERYEEGSRIPTLEPATPQEDAHRRDLTVNSIFYSINNNEVIDFTGKGIKDLISDTFRTPEEPLKTFSDDPLRIFRVIRFAAKYGGKIDKETYKAMLNPSLRDDIKQKISKERMGEEITKMLKNPNAEVAINLLKETGLWQDIITEALRGTPYEGKMAELDMEQNNPHHTLTVWGHTMQVVKNVLDRYPEAEPEKRATMILAALMHDIGKLFLDIHTPSKSHEGRTSYIGHEKESRKIAEHILRYLKMEPFIQQVSGIARHHMRPHFQEKGGSPAGLKAMRKFIRQMGEASLNWLDVFNLAVADAYSKGTEIDPETVQIYQNLENSLQEALVSLKPDEDESIKPILDGNEVMQILGIKPGKWMTEIMEFVKGLRDENPDITKEEASELLREKYQNINPEDIREASSKENTGHTCPMHLLKSKIKEVNNDFKDGNYYKVLQTLKDLKDEYGKDDNVLRLLSISMFKLLLESNKYKDADVLTSLFKNAENNFFDVIVCSYVLGILLLIKTPTEDEVIREIGERMVKMSPGTVKRIMECLPKKVSRPELKKELEKKLCKCTN
jgi:tRNA nucleotidyltransferase (CCA-adding enzyme)